MLTYKEFSLIIVAAGSSSRIGGDVPKQYVKLNGKTILRHTLDVFLNMDGLKDICVVINPAHEDMFRQAVIDIKPITNTSIPISLKGSDYVKYCYGGKTRKDSVHNGIKHLSNLKDDDIILVHDAARPFVTQLEVTRLLDAMQGQKAATLATPVVDTLRYDGQNTAISRDDLWAVQTPQAFHYGLLKQAHEQYSDGEYTDDTSLVSKMDIPVKFINSSKKNFKITLSEDLELAKQLLSTNLSTRTCVGQGYDVHAFDDIEAHSVRLCGVDISHDKPLKGHSDADVGLHALTDAILGAIGDGDIGQHFPPSDNSFKNMDSAEFVRHAMTLLRDKGGELINADITLICEAPKIGIHRDKIKKRVAGILKVSIERVNIKATTTEKLGFTGRGEGIAAQAITTVSIPMKMGIN